MVGTSAQYLARMTGLMAMPLQRGMQVSGSMTNY